MSWSGSGSATIKSGSKAELNISVSPQTNSEAAKDGSLKQIDVAKTLLTQALNSGMFGEGEFTVSLSGHFHSNGDAGNAMGINLYQKGT